VPSSLVVPSTLVRHPVSKADLLGRWETMVSHCMPGASRPRSDRVAPPAAAGCELSVR
jgi:hypothetical protein